MRLHAWERSLWHRAVRACREGEQKQQNCKHDLTQGHGVLLLTHPRLCGARRLRMCWTAVLPGSDFRPMTAGSDSCHHRWMQERLIRIAGIVTWIAVGIPVILSGATSPMRMAGWAVAFAAFGAGLLMNTSPRTAAPYLVLQTASVLVMVLLLCNGFEGALLVIVAMQLGGVMERRAGIAWIVAQTVLLFGAIAIHWSPHPALLLTPPYLGFQLLAFFTFEALSR